MEADGLLVKTPQGLMVTDLGRLLIRNIAMRFDAYAGDAEGEPVLADDMKSVAIIGAGITGLTAAFYLKRKGVPVTVYEASDRVGGAIQSVRAEGYLAEFGPNTILETSPKVDPTGAGRGAGVAAARSRSQGRGALRGALPAAHRDAGLAAGLLHDASSSPRGPSWPCCASRSCRRAATARRRASPSSWCAASGRSFWTTRLTRWWPGCMRATLTSSRCRRRFRSWASLRRATARSSRGRSSAPASASGAAKIAKDRAPKFSFDEGLQVLPDTLRERLGEAVRLNTTVTRLTQTPEGWTLDVRERGQQTRAEHSAVIYAGTAFKLAEMEVQAADAAAPRRRLPRFAIRRWPASCWASAARTWRIRARGSAC